MNLPNLDTAPAEPPSDEALARRVLDGEVDLYEVLVRRHNQRVYRTVRAVLRDEAEVEDVMQQAYLSAYLNLPGFKGESRFSTWLTRIAVNEALMRRRRARPLIALDDWDPEEHPMAKNLPTHAAMPSPEEQVARHELRAALQRSVEALPPLYRLTFVLREVEGLSTAETATALGVAEAVVKTRLHRAKATLREALAKEAEAQSGGLFTFEAPRCDRITARVMAAVQAAARMT